ncbi:MAG: DnaJ C-terminal domain-containing protein [Phycisphaerales bacterium]|jgi:DnaJ-class molecular chaperone|nr:DnaJ C-terminal domain-containing protein [Phycisphaerales bacterium]
MAADRDPYETLGVSRSASDEEIRSAYRKLARTYHPDVCTEPDAEKKFAAVQEAYEILSDKEKRAAYDRFGHAGIAGGPGSPGSPGGPTGSGFGGGWGGRQQVDPADFEDIFEQMFKGQGGFGGQPQSAARPAPHRGVDVSKNVSVTFQTAALGGTEHLVLDDGSSVDLHIPAGIDDGGKMRLRGRGGIGAAGGTRGDVIVTVKVGGHPYFTRQGLDLLVTVPITIAEAANGTSVRVSLLKGSVDLTIPRGSSSGARLRVRGQGIANEKDARGDLYAVIQIVAPKDLPEETAAELEAIGRTLPDPRLDSPGVESIPAKTDHE